MFMILLVTFIGKSFLFDQLEMIQYSVLFPFSKIRS
jgi:hypothetical protein